MSGIGHVIDCVLAYCYLDGYTPVGADIRAQMRDAADHCLAATTEPSVPALGTLDEVQRCATKLKTVYYP